LLSSSGWPWTHSASFSWVLELQRCTTMLGKSHPF
jgi:hypothetical protein